MRDASSEETELNSMLYVYIKIKFEVTYVYVRKTKIEKKREKIFAGS